ncbi:MAG: hypothetical protein Q4G04_00325 [bacterium]|nr:hypothetical protein [bacterium]
MKEASGELNMTVITVVAIAAIGALLWAFWDDIEAAIGNAWGGGGCTTDTDCTDKLGSNYICQKNNNKPTGYCKKITE